MTDKYVIYSDRPYYEYGEFYDTLEEAQKDFDEDNENDYNIYILKVIKSKERIKHDN